MRLGEIADKIREHRILSIRLSAAILIALLAVALEGWFVFIHENRAADIFVLLMTILALVLVDQIIVLMMGTQIEDVMDELASLEEKLMSKLKAQSSGAQVLQVGEWSISDLKRELSNAQRGEVVRIWTTFFDNETQMREIVTALTGKGVTVNVLLMNQANKALVNGRFRQRADRNAAVNKIASTRDALSDLQAESGETLLKYQFCDTMPFGAFFKLETNSCLWDSFCRTLLGRLAR